MMFSGGKAPANIEFFERKNSTMKKLNKKGFTIVELVIVIAVIAILAGVLIPTFATVVDKANQSKAMQEAKNEYEAYLAEYAKDLDGTQNLVVVAGDYYFEVNNGQFNATANKKAGKTFKGADLTEYKVATKYVNGTKYYTCNSDNTCTEDSSLTETGFAPGTTYYEKLEADLGSDKVAIYAAN